MISLINRGKYSRAVREEFEHVVNRLGGFLGQIFDQDGNIIREETLQAVATIKRIHHGDLSIANGNTQGFSTLPFTVDLEKAYVINNGYTGNGGTVQGRIKFANATLLEGNRDGSTGDGTIDYIVVEYN